MSLNPGRVGYISHPVFIEPSNANEATIIRGRGKAMTHKAWAKTHKAKAMTHEAEAKTHEAEAEVKFTRPRFEKLED